MSGGGTSPLAEGCLQQLACGLSLGTDYPVTNLKPPASPGDSLKMLHMGGETGFQAV